MGVCTLLGVREMMSVLGMRETMLQGQAQAELKASEKRKRQPCRHSLDTVADGSKVVTYEGQ